MHDFMETENQRQTFQTSVRVLVVFGILIFIITARTCVQAQRHTGSISSVVPFPCLYNPHQSSFILHTIILAL
jgi:hypothetical protein